MKIVGLFASKGITHSYLWLEGRALADAGFNIGDNYTQVWQKNILLLFRSDVVAFEGSTAIIKRKVMAAGKQPVIRIAGGRVRDTFGTPKVAVTYGIERITVEPYVVVNEPKTAVVTPLIRHVGSDRQEIQELADMGIKL